MAGPDRHIDHGIVIGLGDDDHPHYYNAARHAADAHTFVSHDSLTGVSADDHHNKSHAHDGADGSGTVAHSATTGKTANDHHAQAHVLDGADHTVSGLTAGHVLKATAATTFGFGQLAHSQLGSVGANDHHAQAHVLNAADHTVSGLTTGHVLQALSATTFGFALTPTHASRHQAAGADEIDGDILDIDWNPANYTPTDVAETGGVDDLTAHLKGIDLAFGTRYATATPGWDSVGTPGAPNNETVNYAGHKTTDGIYDLWFRITLGSSLGTGEYRVNLPVTMVNMGTAVPLGTGWVYDLSANSLYLVSWQWATTTSISAFQDARGAAWQVLQTVPFTFASGDIIGGCIRAPLA